MERRRQLAACDCEQFVSTKGQGVFYSPSFVNLIISTKLRWYHSEKNQVQAMGVRWLQLGTRAPGPARGRSRCCRPGCVRRAGRAAHEEPGTAPAPCPGTRGPPHPTAASHPAQARSTRCLNASSAVSLLVRTSKEHLLAHHPFPTRSDTPASPMSHPQRLNKTKPSDATFSLHCTSVLILKGTLEAH